MRACLQRTAFTSVHAGSIGSGIQSNLTSAVYGYRDTHPKVVASTPSSDRIGGFRHIQGNWKILEVAWGAALAAGMFQAVSPSRANQLCRYHTQLITGFYWNPLRSIPPLIIPDLQTGLECILSWLHQIKASCIVSAGFASKLPFFFGCTHIETRSGFCDVLVLDFWCLVELNVPQASGCCFFMVFPNVFDI